MTRLGISGGRDYRFTADDIALLDELHEYSNFDEVVEGGSTGADAGGRSWGDENMIPVTTFHAAWRRPGRRTYDPSAGPKRNRRMGKYLASGQATWVFFPGDRGTNGAYEIAVELRKTNPDLVIVDRRTIRGSKKVSIDSSAA
jgi:hypothetical protein